MAATVAEGFYTKYGGLASGTVEPEHELLCQYEDFPKEVTGPRVWTREEMQAPERVSEWCRIWSPEELDALEQAAISFENSGIDAEEMTPELFPLPEAVKTLLESIKKDVLDGRGFVLLRGLPVHEWGARRAAVVYLGIGRHMGWLLPQNGDGHLLGHVRDLRPPEITPEVRLYKTNDAQRFHCDWQDIVSLLCLRKSLTGGESRIVSSSHLFNVLQRERPDVVRTLTELWYFDRKGEFSEGQNDWMQAPIFFWFKSRLMTRWDAYFIEGLDRYVSKGLVPALTPAQLEAIRVMEATASRESLSMEFEVGDIQMLCDHAILHAREGFTDPLPPQPGRHILRLWLSIPPENGGWPTPYPDSSYFKRGGVQVNKTDGPTKETIEWPDE